MSCRNCGSPLPGRRRLWCSQKCAADGWYDLHSERHRANVAARRRLRGVPTRDRWLAVHAARRPVRVLRPATAWSPGRRQGPFEISCRLCGSVLIATRLAQRYCSALCSNRASKRRLYAAGSRRRFPRVRYGERRAILERDGWRCGICRAVIDPALKFPHPGSASIDHVDPDGAHAPANWQASHLACNVEKGHSAGRAVAEVAGAHGLTPADLTGRSRIAPIVLARAEAAYRLRFETELFCWQIGVLLGGRDHSTIVHLTQVHDLRRMSGRA